MQPVRPGFCGALRGTDDVGLRKLRPVQDGVFGPVRSGPVWSGLQEVVVAEGCERIGARRQTQ